MTVHTVAQKGFGEGTNEIYDRARPSYQSSALAHIRASIPISPPYKIVEIGAGTGIFTRALLAHPDWTSTVGQIKAVEPSSGMRSVFEKTVTDDRASAQEGSFTSTGIEDGWADLVIMAQAYHWAHPNYEAATAEFHRILKPNGIVVYIWNLEDRNASQWVASLRNRVEQHESGSPQFRLGLWRETFTTPTYQKLFEAPEEKVFEYKLETTADITLERALSKSYIAMLGEEDKAKVVEDLKAILGKKEDKVWIDEEKGVFEYPYQTFVVVAHKKSA